MDRPSTVKAKEEAQTNKNVVSMLPTPLLQETHPHKSSCSYLDFSATTPNPHLSNLHSWGMGNCCSKKEWHAVPFHLSEIARGAAQPRGTAGKNNKSPTVECRNQPSPWALASSCIHSASPPPSLLPAGPSDAGGRESCGLSHRQHTVGNFLKS